MNYTEITVFTIQFIHILLYKDYSHYCAVSIQLSKLKDCFLIQERI